MHSVWVCDYVFVCVFMCVCVCGGRMSPLILLITRDQARHVTLISALDTQDIPLSNPQA